MLATVAFLAFWVVIGLTLFVIAVRGGSRRRPATEAQSRSSRRAVGALFAIFFVAVGIALPLAVGIGSHDSARANIDDRTIKLTSAEDKGREVFGRQCINCHTIAGEGGKTGPNFDILRPPAALVLNAVAEGRQRGNGTMPAGLVSGAQADEVAAYVARVAGQ